MGYLYVEGHFPFVSRKSYEATEAGPRDARSGPSISRRLLGSCLCASHDICRSVDVTDMSSGRYSMSQSHSLANGHAVSRHCCSSAHDSKPDCSHDRNLNLTIVSFHSLDAPFRKPSGASSAASHHPGNHRRGIAFGLFRVAACLRSSASASAAAAARRHWHRASSWCQTSLVQSWILSPWPLRFRSGWSVWW
jgi:hypothetical protein